MPEEQINGEVPDKKHEPDYIIWETNKDLEKIYGNVDSYDGIQSANASRRSFLDIEPNISVRTSFNKDDYYRFRDQERPGQAKRAIKMCMDAYDKVGIIKNVIDLMGDFGSQGITLHHPNKKIEKFYRKWWDKVSGDERSERFLNMLYRCGNVVVQKRYGKITRKIEREMAKGVEVDYEPKKTIVQKKTLPFKYTFLNPLALDIQGGPLAALSDNRVYKIKIPAELKTQSKKPENQSSYSKLPKQIKDAISSETNEIILDPECISSYFYKKDDWRVWANPMINAIIDDIIMLEKMKLADMSALDGAISNIRLWNIGSLDHKILPQRGTIDKLRNILASNVGGGTMDLVWGPELTFTESNTQIYKFLGTEKYQPVLNSIYAGLGIPPTLTGLAGQSGGFTNNFISLKTLIERLEYGRDILREFWMEEIEYVQKAMGFPSPAHIHFDYMILSDEAAEKKLLMDLADRHVISVETLRDKFGVINDVEETRITKEDKMRDKGKIPPKADPYHNGDIEHEYIKIAMNKGEIGIEDVTDIKASHPEVLDVSPKQEKERKVEDKGGRPKFSKDKTGRKQKEVKPKNTPSTASIMCWAHSAQKQVAEIMNPVMLEIYGKKNLRELNSEELVKLENVKLAVLCNINPFEAVNKGKIAAILNSNPSITPEIKSIKNDVINEFTQKSGRSPSIDELRQIHISTYSLLKV